MCGVESECGAVKPAGCSNAFCGLGNDSQYGYIPTLLPKSMAVRTLTVRSGFTLPITWTPLPGVRWES